MTISSLLAPSARACSSYITKGGEVSDITLIGNQGSQAFTPSHSFNSNWCQTYAEYWYWNDALNEWRSYTETGFVTTFYTASNAWSHWNGSYWETRYHYDAGYTVLDMPNTGSAYKPKTTYGMKTRIYNASTGSEAYYYYNVTIQHECYDNALSVQTNPNDVAFLIEADGATPTNTQTGRVTGSRSEANCPLTRVAEIWDDETGNFITLSQAWATVSDQSSASNQMQITIGTEDYATLDNQNIENSVFYLRIRTYDPDSYDANNEISQTFTVTFDY